MVLEFGGAKIKASSFRLVDLGSILLPRVKAVKVMFAPYLLDSRYKKDRLVKMLTISRINSVLNFFLGLTDGEMLEKKTLFDLINPWKIRQQELTNFICDIAHFQEKVEGYLDIGRLVS